MQEDFKKVSPDNSGSQNRDIKFRAWRYGIEKYNIQPQMVSGRNLMWKDGEFISGIWNNEETDIEVECEIIVMQYTGLKDKNGVEIYEDDYADYKGKTYKVFYNKYKISLANISGKDIIDLTDSILSDLFIIGNLYENRH